MILSDPWTSFYRGSSSGLKRGNKPLKKWHIRLRLSMRLLLLSKKLKQAGKIRFIGITGLPLGVSTYVLDRVPPGTVDVILSYCHYGINDSTLEDLLPYLKTKGVGVISASPLAMGLLTESRPPEWHPASPKLKVEENVAAAKELEIFGKDEKSLSEIEEILKPVKNRTWPSGIQQS
ncbi:hypothetical protein Vadar_029639 [Vaccinium darrowii]|uniref:Uncharacterized protein n=1 Tax=Vaccinium darrowii TaxID=229202 RepID=A0ACB7Z118_9ERIC|nr:hypothetical protein Vadar_029639 [Vaccinium darrowii]